VLIRPLWAGAAKIVDALPMGGSARAEPLVNS